MPRYQGSGRLAGKTACITGGDSGIGRATAILVAREADRVAIHYRDETEDADTTIKAIRAESTEAVAIKGDIGNPDDVTRAARETLDRFGRVNIVMNNAAVQFRQSTLKAIATRQLETTQAINIFSQFHVVQGFLPQMESGDCILNTTSVTACRGRDQGRDPGLHARAVGDAGAARPPILATDHADVRGSVDLRRMVFTGPSVCRPDRRILRPSAAPSALPLAALSAREP
ncbi:MAG: SDR family NAD(P)-dependent oxidoreductase [Tabrizicola sp.]|uniref:SDR family NAD(P)-dependent oxidoreductase n=1 Tax=Tabrizicola sp. TaxID=2005166 RepID=UPI00273656D0|nr:SDR family NAD(P)-dependent oxidoreductase [Tabrizicola sp.]MDP3262884.1 SDR family NAD(P)-dependent oxidoreductase [Tabrizicola sp.]MDP3649081.1 SDR family NAD(P)-dependent oxidoreductase [Paracoccaceae bacterium]